MEVLSVTIKTQFIFKMALSEIFTPKPNIVFVTKEIKPKKTQ